MPNMLENRNNMRMGTRSSATVSRNVALASNAVTKITGTSSDMNPGDATASASGKRRSLVQVENTRPLGYQNAASSTNFMRQTRACSKRAAMDDTVQVFNVPQNRNAKKRPALANLSNATNIPLADVAAPISRNSTGNIGKATKNKVRTSTQAQDVETQMAGLSVQQKNQALLIADNDENVPPNQEQFPQTEKQFNGSKSSISTSNIPFPLSKTLSLQSVSGNTPASDRLLCTSDHDCSVGGKSISVPSYTDIDNHKDPQMCSSYAIDIYMHLRCAELKRRPATLFMEVIQHEINASMRGILVDWLVEVAEEYKLVPDTLYLTVAYIDRFLSTNAVNRQRLQLVGVTCMLIAAKYEEICAPQVDEFCYITDNTYCREEVLEMERRVLNSLHFELTTPTTKTFLRRFIRAAQTSYKVASLQLEFLGNYLAELTLVDYSFLHYLPSMIAASAVLLAKLTLDQDTAPWNSTLKHYTGYQPCELRDCVKAMYDLQCNTKNCTLPAIREKYRQHKFKCVANLKPLTSLAPEYFMEVKVDPSLNEACFTPPSAT